MVIRIEWNNRVFIKFILCKLWRYDDFHFISLSLVFTCLFELLTVDAKLSRINEMQCISNQHKSKHNKRLSYFKKTRAITCCTLQFPFCKLEKAILCLTFILFFSFWWWKTRKEVKRNTTTFDFLFWTWHWNKKKVF